VQLDVMWFTWLNERSSLIIYCDRDDRTSCVVEMFLQLIHCLVTKKRYKLFSFNIIKYSQESSCKSQNCSLRASSEQLFCYFKSICLLMLPSSRDKKFPELRVAANRLDCQSPNYMGIGIWNDSKDFERET
jgi:hypothetical protein